MSATVIRVTALLMLLWSGWGWLALVPAARAGDAEGNTASTRIDLTAAALTRDGRPVSPPPRIDDTPGGPAVALVCDEQGLRWGFDFETAGAGTHRLELDWRAGPRGLLFELQIDGEFLPPARDGWRPTARDLRSDLGARWLGAGEHRLEVVVRETREDGRLALRGLTLGTP